MVARKNPKKSAQKPIESYAHGDKQQVNNPQVGFYQHQESRTRLARNLHAEIDEDLIEAYRGSVSLPFSPGGRKQIAVKIVDNRGIESLRILEVGE